ncbi:DEAD/DEAH box helicase, partial [Candidatus Bathyarchaeota archaeon]|nr:DEAD/DEAH box helicase [Candidatus Bathyarchaeota archaeon]
MKLKEEVENLLSIVLKELSYHPLIAPYLNISKEKPLQQCIHQAEALTRLALRKPIRILIGDEIGLGKTITAIAIVKYLEKLNRAKRILIIVPRVLVGQWCKELERMGISAFRVKHLERNTIEFWKRQNFPEGYYMASMDLLKREERIQEVVNVQWDLMIIDEVHKFGYKTKRFWEIGKKLVEADPKRNIIFLSATPHRGDPRDYILRLQLLDTYLVEGWRSLDNRPFYEATHGSVLFRRTKEDVNNIYEEREIFPPAKFYAGVINARKDEIEFVARLVQFLRSKLIEFAYEKGLISQRVVPLLIILIFKRAASSPYSAWTTLERLLMKRAAPEFTSELIDSVESFLEIGYEDYEYTEKDPEEIFDEFLDRASPLLTDRDRREIAELRDMAKSIIETGDSKLEALISLLEDVMAEKESKVIIFTEYKDTLYYIHKKIEVERHPEWSRNILKLSSDETRDDRIYQKIRDSFENNPRSRILIATDVVAEGVNLQVAHVLINYEIPWSLIKLEQRIGRVWRLGQKRIVEAYTLFMNNVADSAALNSMYQKLLNLKRAELSPRPVTGQEILLY